MTTDWALDLHTVVDDVRLAYTDRGTGEPILFVHGTPSHSVIWRHVLPPVVRAGHRAIAVDLLGFGASERPVGRDTSVTAQAALLERFLDRLGIDRITLVGHDIGGAVGQILATGRPARVRRLMLIDTVSHDSWPSATWRQIIDEHARGSGEEFEAMLTRQLTMTVADPARMTGEVLDAYLAPHRSPLGRASFFEHQVQHYDSVHTRRIAPLLGELALPVRILWGAEDRWQPVAYGHRLAEEIPGARLTVVPDAGHFLPEDAPGRVVDAVLELCRR